MGKLEQPLRRALQRAGIGREEERIAWHDLRQPPRHEGRPAQDHPAPAGLWTTPSDLARIAIEVSKAKAGTSTRVLSQAMAKQMLTKQSTSFGLGFYLEDGTDEFGHGGSNEGFQSFLTAFADSGSGVAMMANSDNGFLLFERLLPIT